MVEHVFPAERAYDAYREEKGPKDFTVPPVVEELKKPAQRRDCGTCSCLGVRTDQPGVRPLAEISGWSTEIAPEAINCAAPDTGNMGDPAPVRHPEQRTQWLEPLLAGGDPQRVLDDRARGRLQRRPQHPDLDHPRRRRLHHQRHASGGPPAPTTRAARS